MLPQSLRTRKWETNACSVGTQLEHLPLSAPAKIDGSKFLEGERVRGGGEGGGKLHSSRQSA